MLTARAVCYRDSFFLKAEHDTLERLFILRKRKGIVSLKTYVLLFSKC